MDEGERTFIPGGRLGRVTAKGRRALDGLLSEAHVQQTVTEFLELDGWRPIRTDPVSDRKRGKGFGEVGMPDYLYVRYANPDVEAHCAPDETARRHADVMWIEFKAPGRTAKPHQLRWHEAERRLGALVLVIDDINFFIAWYKRSSGMARRVCNRLN